MNLVADKFSNQRRAVIPCCYEDLFDEVVAFLERNGHTTDKIKEAFSSRENAVQSADESTDECADGDMNQDAELGVE